MFTYPNKLIAVTNRRLCPRSLPEQVERIAENGIRTIILREKDLDENEYFCLAEKMLDVCEKHDILLIPHTFTDTARRLGISRIHLPLRVLTKEICEEFDIVGASVHSAEEAKFAESMGCTYVTAGHIFATDCKKGLAPRGLDFLKEVCESVSIPVYAIGGISDEKIPEILSVGAKGGCIMSGAMKL